MDIPAGTEQHVIFVGVDRKKMKQDPIFSLEQKVCARVKGSLGISARPSPTCHYVVDDDHMVEMMAGFIRDYDDHCLDSVMTLVQQTFIYDVSRPYPPLYQSWEKVSWYDRGTVIAVVFAEECVIQDWQYLSYIRDCQRWLGWPEAKSFVLHEEGSGWSLRPID